MLSSRNDYRDDDDDDHDDYDYDNSDSAPSRTRRRSYSGSESSWTDTGDIGERAADNHDPVRLQLSHDIEEELLAGVQRKHHKRNGSQKRVRIHDSLHRPRNHSRSRPVLVDKEAIEVPNFTKPKPRLAERILGAIMSGRSGSIHGLTGKALM